MAKLDRPLYGEYATGTLGRALAFRHTENPPDDPGQPAVYLGTVAKIPVNSCGPSPSQIAHRSSFAAAVQAWHSLTAGARAQWRALKPPQLTGWNFFLRLFLSPDLADFGYCVFGAAWFPLGPTPYQPAAVDYDSLFPPGLDELPMLDDGAHSP